MINNKKISFFFLIFSLVMVLFWYRRGMILGGGEEALAFWNIKSYLSLYKSVWVEIGLGYPWVLYLPKTTFLSLLSILPSFNIIWLKQALFFFISISMGLIGLYLFFLEITDKKFRLQAFFASLFYLFNPFLVSQVLGRFVYQSILAWGYLPLFLYFQIRWLRYAKKRDFMLLIISSLIFSYVFVQPAFIITFWLSSSLFLLSEIFLGANRTKLLKRFVIVFLAWIFSNIWWIYPYVTVGPDSLSGISGYEFNFGSLRGVSKFFPTSEILLLKQKFLFGENGPFSNFYTQPLFNIFSLTGLLLVIFGWISTKGKKYRVPLTVVAIAAWFICKGVNKPFGFTFYNFLFSNFPISFLFRNPYEKFGVAWLLVYSLFLGLGVGYLYKKFKSKYLKSILSATIVVLLLFFAKPVVMGSIFPPTLYIKVPSYYGAANNFLERDKSDGRILMMPMTNGEAVRYKWGYDGAEPSEYLFDKNVLGRLSFFEQKYDEKYLKLYNTQPDDPRFIDLLNEMNISYVILNKDYIPLSGNELKEALLEDSLDKNLGLQEKSMIGNFIIYNNSNNDGSLFVSDNKSVDLSYIKLSPTKYLVTVKNADGPFTLIFKTLFNKRWEATIDGQIIGDHDILYDYANSWKVIKKGDFMIKIEFKVWPWE